jgi:predicted RNA binding protein YcfA (HicA-like mRNA interferase family)
VPESQILKPHEVAKLLEKRGFVLIRQRGSHKQYRHPDGRGTTIPFHGSRDIAPSLLHRIARDVGLTVEELLRQER